MVYQSLANLIMNGMPLNCCNYLDDFLVATMPSIKEQGGVDEHLSCLQTLFSRFRIAGVSFKPSKTKMFQKQVEYVGYQLDRNGLGISAKNLEKIVNLEPVKTMRGIMSFIGSAGYFRRLIPGFSLRA